MITIISTTIITMIITMIIRFCSPEVTGPPAFKTYMFKSDRIYVYIYNYIYIEREIDIEREMRSRPTCSSPTGFGGNQRGCYERVVYTFESITTP